MTPDQIDAALIRLHGSGRTADLSALHEAAARIMPDDDARRFHLTHAWIFGLEAGRADIADLERRLRVLGGL